MQKWTYHTPFSTVDSKVSPVKSTVKDSTVSSLTSAEGGAARESRGRRKTGRIVERRMFATLVAADRDLSCQQGSSDETRG